MPHVTFSPNEEAGVELLRQHSPLHLALVDRPVPVQETIIKDKTKISWCGVDHAACTCTNKQ